ncbi:hypothetical protein [Capnocytophaga catalasegens]|uniref:Uncharacterized protein n=1 Tax=Capnocytophaga catalasegens TaxID=1004260 RepID=A0AAV5B1D8_9FLAO|nr:hypothetical protein [Capnocytophaga catalasegens]GIZ16656.1 hypothetical protein RCZ03_26560 [Capnocytophaga catalasegens]GJM51622.1 hypothetical protein RCZ15_25950 [Capnocytophaga catalasegens]GJM53717.1 hypothetical protein RCZ16_20330 [Capnocytophaga catalasegens]
MFNSEKNNVGAKSAKAEYVSNTPVQQEKNILTQEQIAQMLENEEFSYHSLDVLINDFLFVYTNKDQNYEKVLDVVFMNYFKARPFFTMYDLDEQQMHEAYHFFTMLCRNRELLVQIATDKGIINPKNK